MQVFCLQNDDSLTYFIRAGCVSAFVDGILTVFISQGFHFANVLPAVSNLYHFAVLTIICSPVCDVLPGCITATVSTLW